MNSTVKEIALHPVGALLKALKPGWSLLDIDCEQVMHNLSKYGLLVFRGFNLPDDKDFLLFSKQFGELLEWEFGPILELKINTNPANHIFTSARVELHWDGAFIETKPRFNLFNCLQGSSKEQGGETLFVDTEKVLMRASKEELTLWKSIEIRYSTEKKAHYGGTVQYPLVMTNPSSGRDVIRYIEAFNEDSEEINPMKFSIFGPGGLDEMEILMGFNRRLYGSDVMYRHTWHKGDFLIADNSRLLHGRSRFTNSHASRLIKRTNVI